MNAQDEINAHLADRVAALEIENAVLGARLALYKTQQCEDCGSRELYVVCDCGWSDRLEKPKKARKAGNLKNLKPGRARKSPAPARTRALAGPRWLTVIDLETTALTPSRGQIVEIGIARVYLDNGRVEKVLDAVVRPEGAFDRNAWVFKNTTLTPELVDSAKPLTAYRTQIQNILDKNTVTAYNKAFDFGFLRAAGFVIKNEFPCLMETATSTCKIEHPFFGFKYPKVTEAWSYYFPERYVELHRAYDDAEHEARLLFEMWRRGDFKGAGAIRE